MNKNVACMCTVSHGNNNLQNEWIPLITNENYDKFLIVDVTKNNETKNGFLFNETEIREKFKFKHDVSKKHYWNSYGNRNIIWFYAHLRMMNFYVEHPNYEYYWFFDDDVQINNWSEFLMQTDMDNSDFISYFIFKKDNVISQPHIPKMDDKTTSKHLWFERFPGDGDVLPANITEYFGSFFPTTRYSNNALKKLVELNFEGFYAYSEGYVPTVLNHFNFSLNTLITSDNKSQIFNFEENKIYHKNIVVDWSWI